MYLNHLLLSLGQLRDLFAAIQQVMLPEVKPHIINQLRYLTYFHQLIRASG